MVPYFFVSHAVSGSGRRDVEHFHADLQAEIRARLGREPRFDGVLADHRGLDVRAGPPPTTPAMNCRSLVVLYSQEYFRSPRCTYDLSVFDERMSWRVHRTGDTSVAPVGVVWDAAGLPARLAEETARQSGPTGSDYPRHSVGQLIRDPLARGGYIKILRSVADRVLVAADRSPPTMTARDVGYLTPFRAMSRTSAVSWDVHLAPLPVPWHSRRAGASQDPAPMGAALGLPDSPPRTRSWFSSPGEGERPILRGPHG
ncbi:hypothetical protein FHS35_004074 [Streptomyces umbrinus]|uniref:hypothetical protein n=1 Tax=Streptomyces umbrinus TaxID=67370 RepID=UPI0016773943|nr:hypothetical protein [Streptomyces umbrinus]MCR3727219.1 hypothetical protein [Streptomyces umbrinus]GHB75878.1 hypothetical protein GCM10010306_082180 [Streptomyces umbrinus]GHH54460.1 hypothetical protein GCM10018775_57620 [Streptomyces umbrinus]